MTNLLAKLIATAWNWFQQILSAQPRSDHGLFLGNRVVEERITSEGVYISQTSRTQHVVLVGKTGFGKSRFIWNALTQDIRARRGFAILDQHSDTFHYVLRFVATEEQRTGEDLSGRLIPIKLLDPLSSVGFNPLETVPEFRFRQSSEIAALLKKRFELSTLGARTEELTRNIIHLAADANLTLVDIPALLTSPAYLASALARVTNEDVRHYFQNRYGQASEQFQATMREPLLNKLSAFIGNPAFRHLLGQSRSTFSFEDALDQGHWVVIDMQGGQLGPEVITFAGLILTWLQAAIFRRTKRRLFTIVADEVQKLVAHTEALEVLLSESRKQGIGVLTANQFTEQYDADVRAALLSAANFVLFRLSAPDAEKFASHLGGGRSLAELLKNLPQRHAIVKHGDQRPQHIVVPHVDELDTEYSDLYNRCRARWMRPRTDIEAEIRNRYRQAESKEGLDAWD